ncbi:MAG: 50S ribosomal protein L35ae [Candidatus Nanoarchaeia archaeon]
MKATVVNFRRSKHRTRPNQMILQVEGVDSKDKAEGMIGKKVTWKSPAGKELKGEISAAHGNSGAVRVKFETGMPGQAVGTEVEVQ